MVRESKAMHIQTKRFVTVVEKGNGIHVLLINLAVSSKESYLESNFKNHLGKCRDCVGGQLTVHTHCVWLSSESYFA